MRSEKVLWTDFRTGVQLPSSPLQIPVGCLSANRFFEKKNSRQNLLYVVRSTGLEPVPVAGHAPQTCAYADSATTANNWIIFPVVYFVKIRWYKCIVVYHCRSAFLILS